MCGDCPSKGDLHKDLGLIYCRSGSLDKGERELRIAQGLKPNDPYVKKSLELIAELKGQPGQGWNRPLRSKRCPNAESQDEAI
jgi:hypothetical protein